MQLAAEKAEEENNKRQDLEQQEREAIELEQIQLQLQQIELQELEAVKDMEDIPTEEIPTDYIPTEDIASADIETHTDESILITKSSTVSSIPAKNKVRISKRSKAVVGLRTTKDKTASMTDVSSLSPVVSLTNPDKDNGTVEAENEQENEVKDEAEDELVVEETKETPKVLKTASSDSIKSKRQTNSTLMNRYMASISAEQQEQNEKKYVRKVNVDKIHSYIRVRAAKWDPAFKSTVDGEEFASSMFSEDLN
jgi:hypothetical protein